MNLSVRAEQFIKAIISRLEEIHEALRNQVASEEKRGAASEHDQENEWRARVARTFTDREIQKRTEQKSYAQSQKALHQQGLLNFFTGLAVLGAWLYAAVAAYQALEMRRATRATEEAAKIAAQTLNENAYQYRRSLKESQRQFDITSKSDSEQFQRTLAEIQKQTTAQEQTAKSSSDAVQATKDAMYLEERPWVGIEIVATPNPANIEIGKGSSASSLAYRAHNTGRTPALKWRVECCENFDRPSEEVVPSYDDVLKEMVSKLPPGVREFVERNPDQRERYMASERKSQEETEAFAAQQQETIPPDGTTKTTTMTISGADDFLYHFEVGKFVYWDAIDPTRVHTTQFCFVQYRHAQIRLCKSDQDMN